MRSQVAPSDTASGARRAENASEIEQYLHIRQERKQLFPRAVLVGLAAGAVAVGFRIALAAAQVARNTVIDWAHLVPTIGWAFPVAFGAAGAAASVWLVRRFAPEAAGSGIPHIEGVLHRLREMEAMRLIPVKFVGGLLALGSGLALGREGPSVQLGGAVGAFAADRIGRGPRDRLTLIAAGAGAGLAAAFNAPLGGMAFAIEVILGELTTGPFAMVVLSTVTAAAVSRGLHGFDRFFQIPPYQMVHWGELVLYFALGLASGVTAKLFQRAFYRIEEAFEDFQRVAPQWKPAVGGLLVGAIGFFLPGILGPGYEVMNRALNTNILWYVLLLLIPAKMLATSLTLGSGGSGGTLMPSLFLGCILGSLFGQGLQWAIPTIVDSRAYALVGMAAVFAGLVHAPLTGMLILFEMTGDYAMILPLMIATVTATLVGRTMEPNSIYVEKLVRLGVKLGKDSDASLLTSTPVGDIMTSNVKTLRSDFPIGRLGKTFNRMNLGGFPVVDAEGLLVGMVTFAEAQAAYRSEPPPPPDAPVSQIMRDSGPPLFPEDSAGEALRRMDQHNIDRLPVVDPDEPRRVAGIVSQKDLLRLYAKRIAARPRVDPV